jgi:uncharacterized tellurite resistance protein B-like protein
MLTQIKRFFDRNLLPGATEEGDAEHALRLAVGALLLEVVRLDGEVRADERQAVEIAVLGHFDLSAEEAEALLKLAEDERRDATDYFQFTSLINRHYSPQRKIELIERLWSIAYADQTLHPYEEHLVRKIADLLYVAHNDFIAAKLRARP